MQAELVKHGVDVVVNDGISAFEESLQGAQASDVVLKSGRRIPAGECYAYTEASYSSIRMSVYLLSLSVRLSVSRFSTTRVQQVQNCRRAFYFSWETILPIGY
jgi:hypothetical protein